MTENSRDERKTIHERLSEIKRRYTESEYVAPNVSADDRTWLINQVSNDDAELSFREACCAELVRIDSRDIVPLTAIQNFIFEKIQQAKRLQRG